MIDESLIDILIDAEISVIRLCHSAGSQQLFTE